MSNFSPAMGNASSQLASTQSQDPSQEIPETQDSLPQVDGTAMDDATQREEPRVKKRRNASGDAIRPTKKSRKDREHDTAANMSTGLEHDDKAVQATGEITRKRSKKKSKREAAQHNNPEDASNEVSATQESFPSQGLPQSTADTMNGADGNRPAKGKRKRPTGRPSGLNLLPASQSDPTSQDNSIQDRTASPAVVRGFTAVNSPQQPQVSTQTPSKKPQSSKDAKRRSAHISPEFRSTQNSEPAKDRAASPTTPKQPVAKQKRQSRVADRQEPELIPTPRDANEDILLDVDNVPTPPDTVPGDDGALRDDYSEVDATGQVKGWLSDQVPNGAVPETPRASSDTTLRKKAAVNSSAQRTEGEKTRNKQQKRSSQHRDDDTEDYQPKNNRKRNDNDGEATTITETDRRRNVQPRDTAAGELEETPVKNSISPRASKKRKRLSKGHENVNDEDTPHQREPVTPKAGSRKKNKRPKSPADDGEDEAVPSGSPAQINGKLAANSDAAQKKQNQRNKNQGPSSKKRSSTQAGADKDSTEPSNKAVAKGPFTAQEKDKVDNIFKDTMAESGMSDAEFRASLQNWRDAVDFKRAVEEALPNRPVAAVRKFCQRRYHNLERGPWTPEQDEGLKNAYATNPDKWTEISALVGRTAADCKDRWKNSVSIEKTVQLGPWSKEDEAALVEAVASCVKEMKKAHKADKNFPIDRAELEAMISWGEVAKKLGGTRSVKRCHEKWQKLKKREESGPSKASTEPLPTGLNDKSSKKLKAAEKLYNQCDVGDLFDILTEIHTAIPNHTWHYDHESTVWSAVSMKHKNSKFTSAMRRRGLHDAADVYRDDIGRQPTIAATAKALADYLEDQWGLDTLREKRSFDPSAAKNRRHIKSSELVDSDEDVSDDDQAQRGAITKERDSDEEVSEAQVEESESE